MGIMARDVVLCALVLVQFLCVGQCYRGVHVLSDRKLELPKHGLLNAADKTNVRSAPSMVLLFEISVKKHCTSDL